MNISSELPKPCEGIDLLQALYNKLRKKLHRLFNPRYSMGCGVPISQSRANEPITYQT